MYVVGAKDGSTNVVRTRVQYVRTRGMHAHRYIALAYVRCWLAYKHIRVATRQCCFDRRRLSVLCVQKLLLVKDAVCLRFCYSYIFAVPQSNRCRATVVGAATSIRWKVAGKNLQWDMHAALRELEETEFVLVDVERI